MKSSNDAGKRRSPKDGPAVKGGSTVARRTAALILEVWAGELHPSEAAAALEIGMPRYYQIEKKAFSGVISSCEPAEHKGRQKSEEKVIDELRTQIKILERDLRSAQALARFSNKAEGIASVVSQAKSLKARMGANAGVRWSVP